MEELKWKIINFASNYEVSQTGLVRNRTSKKILSGRETKSGYLQVCIKMNATNKFQNQYVHRLVALFWIPNPENKKEVNHKDGNKLNNNIENLEWVTSHENLIHKTQILGKNKTSNRQVGMYTKDGEQLLKTFSSVVEASSYFGKSRINIDNALKHKQGQQTAYDYVWKYLD